MNCSNNSPEAQIIHLRRVKDRKNVDESFVKWRQKTKQPRDPKQRTHYQACSDGNSAKT